MPVQRHVRDIEWLRRRVDVDLASGCWNWRGNRNHKGYGRYHFTTDAGVFTGSAHRLALELALGRPIRTGLYALHHCDNPACCNGEHLYEGTQEKNLSDCRDRGRQVIAHGMELPQAKLSEADIPNILKALATGTAQRTLARRYGVDQAQISRIKNGKAWVRTLEPNLE